MADREKWAIAGGISIGMHFFAALALALAPTTPPSTLERLAPTSFTIDVSTPSEPVRPVEPAPPDPPCCPSTPPAPRRREPMRPSSPTVAPAPALVDEVVTPLVTAREPEREPIDRPIISLDPSRHAAWQVLSGPGPTMPGEPAGLEDDSPDRRPTPIAEALAIVQGSITTEANARGAFSERPYPVVQRPDGAYHYEGQGFEGIIEPDGSIHFSDRPGLSYDAATGSGAFDLVDAIMRSAGLDPCASERLGFLDATEELRERLEDEARAAAAVRSLRGLRGRVASIWQDETRSPAARRRSLFDLWDQQADGEEGAPARDVVMAFIREERSFGSDILYGPGELARLNAERESIEPFQP